jgi:hypothetical protein
MQKTFMEKYFPSVTDFCNPGLPFTAGAYTLVQKQHTPHFEKYILPPSPAIW